MNLGATEDHYIEVHDTEQSVEARDDLIYYQQETSQQKGSLRPLNYSDPPSPDSDS